MTVASWLRPAAIWHRPITIWYTSGALRVEQELRPMHFGVYIMHKKAI
jgi:hypothetical protein